MPNDLPKRENVSIIREWNVITHACKQYNEKILTPHQIKCGRTNWN